MPRPYGHGESMETQRLKSVLPNPPAAQEARHQAIDLFLSEAPKLVRNSG
jgi:hypothetical protein